MLPVRNAIAAAGERRFGKPGQEGRAQQLGVELRHAPAILAVAIFQEFPEGEILEKHACLRGGKIHAVIDLLAPADGTNQPADRPAIEAQRHQMPEPALTLLHLSPRHPIDKEDDVPGIQGAITCCESVAPQSPMD